MSDAVAGGSGADGRVVAPDRLVEIVAESVADVVRAEVRAVRGQLVGALRPAGVGFVLLGTAGACAVLGVGAASTTVLRMLESFLPKKLAAAGMTAGYLAAAAVLGRLGLNQLHAAGGGPPASPTGSTGPWPRPPPGCCRPARPPADGRRAESRLGRRTSCTDWAQFTPFLPIRAPRRRRWR